MTSFPIFDGHNDTLLRLWLRQRGREAESFIQGGDGGHLDLPRARAGGFGGGLFAVFVPSPKRTEDQMTAIREGWALPVAATVDQAEAWRAAAGMTAALFRIERASDGAVKVCRTARELRDCLERGVLAPVLHFEGAEPIDVDLDALEVFHRAGLRSLGIVWSRPNAFGHGVPFRFPSSPDTGPGLTEAGHALVHACDALGILLDVSHLNEAGFWDVTRLCEKPFVASHSNAHALSGTSRNLTDRQLDAIRERKGLVGLNFSVTDVRPDGRHDADTPLEMLVRQLDYLVGRLGIDGVGFGMDMDGATIPRAVGDAAGLPSVVEALRQAGWDDEALRRVCFENWIAVLERVWPLERGSAAAFPALAAENDT